MQAPEHLRPATAAWFDSVVVEFALEAHHYRLLQLAAESWDRGQQAREALEANGLVPWGQPRREGLRAAEVLPLAVRLRALLDSHQPERHDRPVPRERVVPCLQEVLVT